MPSWTFVQYFTCNTEEVNEDDDKLLTGGGICSSLEFVSEKNPNFYIILYKQMWHDYMISIHILNQLCKGLSNYHSFKVVPNF
jgi:hypothetical protein